MHYDKLAERTGAIKTSAVRELLKHSKLPGVISLGGGIPAPELFDREGLDLAVTKSMEFSFNDGFQYGLSEGYFPLREEINKINLRRGVRCDTGQVFITSGSQQSLDIIARTLLNPGDAVLVERPTYLAALQVFQLAEANILSAETDDNGLVTDAVEELLLSTKIKAVYLVPTFGNPGGKTLSDERRKALVSLAEKHDFIIIEDDPYGELSFTGEQHKSLYQHSQEQNCPERVIYTSTLSKIMAPGLRTGWIVLPEWAATKALAVKQASDLHSNSLSQVVTTHYLQLDRLHTRLPVIREFYRRKCDALVGALRSELHEHIEFSRPEGGMFLWARFRYEFNTTEWLKRTLSNGVVYVPGEAFYHTSPDTRSLRLSFSTATESEFAEAVQRLKLSL